MPAICPWCSATLTEGATECPSCGANLVPDGDPDVPGVTAVDAASIIRSRTASQPRSRLLSWISGEYSSDLPSKAESQAIAPPDLAVRREILRLELEAEVANLQAEADALLSEAAAEGRTIERPARPPEAAPMTAGESTVEAAPSTDGETVVAPSEADAVARLATDAVAEPQADPVVPSDSEAGAVAEPATAAPTATTEGERDPGTGQPTA